MLTRSVASPSLHPKRKDCFQLCSGLALDITRSLGLLSSLGIDLAGVAVLARLIQPQKDSFLVALTRISILNLFK